MGNQRSTEKRRLTLNPIKAAGLVAVCLLAIVVTRVAPYFIFNTPLVLVPESKLELSCSYITEESKRGVGLEVYLGDWLASPSFSDTLRLLLASRAACTSCYWGFISNEDFVIDFQKKVAERLVNLIGFGTLSGDLYEVSVTPSRVILTAYNEKNMLNKKLERTIDRSSGRYVMARYPDGTLPNVRTGEAFYGSIGWCQATTGSNLK